MPPKKKDTGTEKAPSTKRSGKSKSIKTAKDVKPKSVPFKKARYLFKITVVGPEDRLLESVLRVFNVNVVAVDGIRIGSAAFETDSTDVKALTMSPKHSALDVLLSMTFKGANGVMIVLPDADPEMETLYRNEVREQLGAGTPTRVIVIESELDDYKRAEISLVFEEIIEEIVASRVEE
jgi:hypothetical protein